MFSYDKTKTYTLTNNTEDIENYVGCRIPMLMKRPIMFEKSEYTEDEIISRLSKFLYFTCIFENTWRAKGATDCRTLPISNGVFMFTALKDDEVLKQTQLIL